MPPPDVSGENVMSFDLLIKNARICDGSGGPSFTGSVAVRDGRIVAVGDVAGDAA